MGINLRTTTAHDTIRTVYNATSLTFHKLYMYIVYEKNIIKSVFLSRYSRILARYHTCQLTYLKISSMNLWLVTNHMNGFRIRLSDWSASRKFMEEILS